MEKETVNKNNNSLIIIIVALVFIIGFLAGQLLNKDNTLKVTTNTEEKVNNKTEDNKPKDNKPEEKETKENIEEKEENPPKEDTKPTTEEKEPGIEEDDSEIIADCDKNHLVCNVCDEEGSICCGTCGLPDILNVDVKEANANFESIELNNKTYKYTVKYSKKDGMNKIEINGKVVFNSALKTERVFILDNGMIGIQYYDPDDQALLRKRNYFDTKVSLIKTIEGIKSNVDIFEKEYEYVSLGDKCINNSYRELKTYKVTINKSTIDTKLIKTEKEDGCAGMV